ncbi:MAG: PaaI family thioesterase [Caulobacterales bacterium]|nr:PaaI family thioesterase [Caulobacterales bacterium]
MTPPEGFALLSRPSPLIDPWRPLFMREALDGVTLGIQVREPHTNSRGTVHGGQFAALADQGMGMSCAARLKDEGVPVANLWTSSMTVDYLGVARPGQWLAFDTVFCRPGKTLCHAEMDITADGETVARARGAFRVTLERAAAA